MHGFWQKASQEGHDTYQELHKWTKQLHILQSSFFCLGRGAKVLSLQPSGVLQCFHPTPFPLLSLQSVLHQYSIAPQQSLNSRVWQVWSVDGQRKTPIRLIRFYNQNVPPRWLCIWQSYAIALAFPPNNISIVPLGRISWSIFQMAAVVTRNPPDLIPPESALQSSNGNGPCAAPRQPPEVAPSPWPRTESQHRSRQMWKQV